uniref:Uncharacterized protein n=1 Tax=Zea mays TaxID=4577 RepID=B6TV16_MAIZE|nr:hypothetical protein [Zea mays]
MATVTEEVAPVVTVSEEPAPEAAKEVVEKPEGLVPQRANACVICEAFCWHHGILSTSY